MFLTKWSSQLRKRTVFTISISVMLALVSFQCTMCTVHSGSQPLILSHTPHNVTCNDMRSHFRVNWLGQAASCSELEWVWRPRTTTTRVWSAWPPSGPSIPRESCWFILMGGANNTTTGVSLLQRTSTLRCGVERMARKWKLPTVRWLTAGWATSSGIQLWFSYVN